MKLVYRILLLIVLIGTVYVLTLYNPAGKIVYFRLLVLLFILSELALIFKEVFINKPHKELVKNIVTICFALFALFIFLESVFMFVSRSHFVGSTLGHQLFKHKYWNPINSLGFRDREPENNKDSAILFIGDSFTEGWGIKDVKDRYSDIVRDSIGGKYRNYCIANIGRSGFETKREFETLINFVKKTNIKPAKIYLQYFGNDILNIADSIMPYSGYFPYDNLPKAFIPVVKTSYFLNYAYWLIPQKRLLEFNNYLSNAYLDSVCLNLHLKELDRFINYSKQNNVELTVILFPFLTNLELSKKMYIDKLLAYFKQNNINSMDVSDLIKDIPVSERIVNINDQHPSVKVNKLVAIELLKQF